MQPSPSGNPFADPPANTAETSAPQSGTPAQPGPSTNAGATEGTTKVTATLERYPEVPVTGYPVQYSGGAFSTAYPQYGSSSSSYPQYPPPVEPSNAPLYSTFEQSAPYQNPAPATPLTCGIGAQVIMHNLLLVESHFRKVGRPILEGEIEISEVAKALWNAPFVVLAHDKGPEPKFVYGNKAALELWECSWDELVGTPSRRSAEDKVEIQEDRQGLLDTADKKGFVDDYEGWRVSFTGRRFKIMRATLFNVEAPSGDLKGQAVVIPEWEYEDGTRGGVGGPAGSAPPTPEDIQAAEAAVQEQAAAVRQLKEDQGLTNADDAVKAAVAELLARKEKLEHLKQRAAAAGAEGQGGGAQTGSQEAAQ
ncbi:hypothetical protein N2152v2_003559 [Parachlorella kessleri]